MDRAKVHRAMRRAVTFNVVSLVVAVLPLPVALFGTEWMFTRVGFTSWCIVSFMWMWCSVVVCIVWLTAGSWEDILTTWRGVVRD
jgi:hypothetical protein